MLVAEDNAVNQRVVIRMLETAGCRVDVVANGREAVDAMARLAYDLVFMDCQMPEMDGYEATPRHPRASASGASGRRVPIVALTANALQGDREQCLAAGMDDYLAKPITKDAFGASLRRWGIQGGPPTDGSIDAAALAELAAIDGEPGQPNLLAELLDVFRQDTPVRLAAVRAAIESGDTDGVRRGAHAFKGSCAALGLRHLQALCATLESRGGAGTAAEAHRTARGDGGRARPAAALAPRRALARQRADRGRGDLRAAATGNRRQTHSRTTGHCVRPSMGRQGRTTRGRELLTAKMHALADRLHEIAVHEARERERARRSRGFRDRGSTSRTPRARPPWWFPAWRGVSRLTGKCN